MSCFTRTCDHMNVVTCEKSELVEYRIYFSIESAVCGRIRSPQMYCELHVPLLYDSLSVSKASSTCAFSHLPHTLIYRVTDDPSPSLHVRVYILLRSRFGALQETATKRSVSQCHKNIREACCKGGGEDHIQLHARQRCCRRRRRGRNNMSSLRRSSASAICRQSRSIHRR